MTKPGIGLLSALLDPVFGGPAYAAQKLSVSLRTSGYKVRLVGLCDEHRRQHVQAFSQADALVPIGHPRLWFPGLGLQSAFNRCRDADLWHAQMFWDGCVLRTVMHAKQRRLPCVISPRGSLFEERLQAPHKRLYLNVVVPLFNKFVSAFHALTEREAKALRSAGLKSPIHVIPNYALPPALVEAGEREMLLGKLGIDPNRRWLLNLGRIAQGKGVTTLLKAFSRLPDRTRKEWGVIIAGPDYRGYAQTVLNCIRELGIEERVAFCGNLEGAAKEAVLHSASLFVQLSSGEAMSNSILEALSHGLPVVLTPECEMQAVAEHEAGWLIPRSDCETADRLAEILRLPTEELARVGANARRLAETEYSEQAAVRKYVRMYQEVLA